MSASPHPTDAIERRWLWTIIVLHLLLIALPYLWVMGLVPEGRVWRGLLYSTDDQNVHLAWAKQAAQGHFFIRDLFTTENLNDNSRPLFFNALTWLMGTVSRLSGATLIWVYHAFRLLGAVAALKCFHTLCAHLTDDRRVRIGAVALAAFAASWGWIRNLAPGLVAHRWLLDRPFIEAPVGNVTPFSLMVPEAFGPTSAFCFVLNVFSFALLCTIFSSLLRAHNGERRALAIGCAAALLLANIHTYDALPMIATLLAWCAWNWKKPHQSTLMRVSPLIIIAAALLPIAYQFIVFQNSDEFRIKALTPTLAPRLFDLAFSLAPLFIPALCGIVMAWRRPNLNTKVLLPALWMFATLLLIYAPVSFARKMIEGLHLPLCFLMTIAFVWLFERLPSDRTRRAAWATVMGLYSISTLQFIGFCIGTNWQDNNDTRGSMPPLTLSKGDDAALQFLDGLSAPQKSGRAVLCLPKLGGWVPGATGMNVFVGHWAETLNHNQKVTQAFKYFGSQMSRDDALFWLRANRIGYIIEGEYERGVFAERLPSARFGLRPIFKQNDTTIYEVPPSKS